MTFAVLVPQAVDEAGLRELRAAGLAVVEAPDTDPATLRSLIGNCQGVLFRNVALPAELLRAAPDLRVVSRHGVGLDNLDLAYCRQAGIQVTYTPQANATAVAEHTIALMLAIAKDLRAADSAVRRGDFGARDRQFGIELAGLTLGVVGLGRTGREVARRAVFGLDMRVVGTSSSATDAAAPPGVRLVALDELLATADVVSLHVPLTPDTRSLIGSGELATMKADLLVNCSRGGVVDEAALVDALRRGVLRSAALDVFEEEPLPAGHPLTRLENVVLTPHVAAHTAQSLARMAVHAAQGIIAVAHGQQPEWPFPDPTSAAGRP